MFSVGKIPASGDRFQVPKLSDSHRRSVPSPWTPGTFKKPRQTNRYASAFFKHRSLKDLTHLIRQNRSDWEVINCDLVVFCFVGRSVTRSAVSHLFSVRRLPSQMLSGLFRERKGMTGGFRRPIDSRIKWRRLFRRSSRRPALSASIALARSLRSR